jgi:hypothetical protein
MATGGMYFQLGHDGRVAYVPEIGLGTLPGNNSITVTGPFDSPDPGIVIDALHAAAAIPLPVTGRWMIAYEALKQAVQSGTRVVLIPITS